MRQTVWRARVDESFRSAEQIIADCIGTTPSASDCRYRCKPSSSVAVAAPGSRKITMGGRALRRRTPLEKGPQGVLV